MSTDTASKKPNGEANGSKEIQTLPKLPLPKLEDTCKRYLRALEALQDEDEHERTKGVVKEFLESGEGAKWQKKLEEYNNGVDSYIEEFWYESYLSFQDSVVLSLVRVPFEVKKSLTTRIHSLSYRKFFALRIAD